MKVTRRELTLDQPAIYQIKVPGRLDKSCSEWVEGITIRIESVEGDASTTTMTGKFADQAALYGLLRRLYSQGVPLISVNRIEGE